MTNQILIYDPVPFKGGSKKVMKSIVEQLPTDIEVWVISNDKSSWQQENVHFIELYSPAFLQNQTTGLLFFIKHFLYLFSIISNMLRLKRFSKVIGFSGPSVDFALYLLTELFCIDVIQLVQGDIANSKVAKFGLTRAKKVFYLPSTHHSIINTLKTHNALKIIDKEKFMPFINGINKQTIKPKKRSNQVVFLWAASLLKWKRIELFIEAMHSLNNRNKDLNKYCANICYIPADTNEQIANDEINPLDNVQWYADPSNLNEIRANSSVFISTSENEPFGLSILESMAAGLAIVIPADNAYWDQQLTDGYNCIKYDPNNRETLVYALQRLIDDEKLLSHISIKAKHSAKKYCASRCYQQILNSIPN